MKKQFKSQASSGRAALSTAGFGVFGSGDSQSSSSSLAYVYEPPDLTGISDPNIAVHFKNLMKRDTTTKSKALDELSSYFTNKAVVVEDAHLAAWVRLFPRLSIDTARRVRQLAHIVQGRLASRLGKRLAPQLPQLIGPWICGTYDSDRGAAQAAKTALRDAFPTEEKVKQLWKAMQRQLVDYSKDAILNESPQTLSDERVVSKEDSVATYDRVISTALATLLTLVSTLPAEELEKQFSTYESLFREQKPFEFSTSPDPATRRYLFRLIRAVLSTPALATSLEVPTVGTVLISKALAAEQTTTASEVLVTLSELTRIQDTIWTTDYKSKKPQAQRLKHFIKQGSQLSPEYWPLLVMLYSQLPQALLPTDNASVSDVLSALLDGVTKREERLNASTAWPAYFRIADQLLGPLEENARIPLIQSYLIPVLSQYLEPIEAAAKWTISAKRPEVVVAEMSKCRGVSKELVELWPARTTTLVEEIKTSQPEQSKDFAKSQDLVGAAGARWTLVQSSIETLNSDTSPVLLKVFADQVQHLVQEVIKLLLSRQGKPYGAASVLSSVAKYLAENTEHSEATRASMEHFLRRDAISLLESPSRHHLYRALCNFFTTDALEEVWTAWLHASLEQKSAENKLLSIKDFLAATQDSRIKAIARKDTKLQETLQALSTSGDAETRKLLEDLLPYVSTETQLSLMTSSLARLSTSATPESAVEALTSLERLEAKTLRDYSKTKDGNELISQLILLEQTAPAEVAAQAVKIRSRLGDAMGAPVKALSVDYIRQELNQATPRSLPIDLLLGTISASIDKIGEELSSTIRDLVPVWQRSIDLAIPRTWSPSLALLSPLGGSVQLTKSESMASVRQPLDVDGLGVAVRIGLVALVALSTKTSATTEALTIVQPMCLLAKTAMLVDDNLSIPGSNLSWANSASKDVESLMVDFVTRSRQQIVKTLDSITAPELLSHLQQETNGKEVQHALSARVFIQIASELIEGAPSYIVPSQMEDQLRSVHKDDSMTKFALGAVLGPHLATLSYVKHLINELVSSLTHDEPFKNGQTTPADLIMLNTLLNGSLPPADLVARPRLVPFVKLMLHWLEDDALAQADSNTRPQVYMALRSMLPLMHDVFGEHWDLTIAAICRTWNDGFVSRSGDLDEHRLVLIHQAVRLEKSLLQLIKQDDANEDLIDALEEHDFDLQSGLLKLILQDVRADESRHAPLRITNELIGRQAQTIATVPAAIAEQLYQTLSSTSASIQETGFSLLDKHIRQVQEQVSFDAALEKKAAHLPDELLSLMLAAPDVDDVLSASFTEHIPTELQTYLLSWLLVFAHFDSASHKVKEDYVEDLKSGNYLSSLLNIVFDFLGHTVGTAVDASKFSVSSYTLHEDDTPEGEVQHLLTHLYYLSLLYLPSLTKTHYFSITKRATSTTISAWTAKFISAQIIDKSLASVEEWAASMASDAENENFSIKVNNRTKEITASFLLDEQSISMMIRLPDEYPLQGAKVEGVSRVALDTRKWQSWLRNCQGVIQFSNGNVVDGLNSWRRNVLGAFKGAIECAICYSIVSMDKQLPSKKCVTCKNLFHSSCLFKWFKSSNGSTCPLCRCPFNYADETRNTGLHDRA